MDAHAPAGSLALLVLRYSQDLTPNVAARSHDTPGPEILHLTCVHTLTKHLVVYRHYGLKHGTAR